MNKYTDEQLANIRAHPYKNKCYQKDLSEFLNGSETPTKQELHNVLIREFIFISNIQDIVLLQGLCNLV